jgi:hypothetical protein
MSAKGHGSAKVLVRKTKNVGARMGEGKSAKLKDETIARMCERGRVPPGSAEAQARRQKSARPALIIAQRYRADSAI